MEGIKRSEFLKVIIAIFIEPFPLWHFVAGIVLLLFEKSSKYRPKYTKSSYGTNLCTLLFSFHVFCHCFYHQHDAAFHFPKAQ